MCTACRIPAGIQVMLGCSQEGKATGFGPVIRGFKSFRPSHFCASEVLNQKASPMYRDMKILTGTANLPLAQDISSHLSCPLTPVLCETFSDGEIRIEISSSVRGDDVFVIQPTCAPVNTNLMQLCLMLDALKRASAGRVTVVIPYYGYARQDRKVSPRAPISAKLVADFLSVSGAERVVTVDLHAGQIQGFFNCPVDNLFATRILLEPILAMGIDPAEIAVVSPDAGGVERARAFAKRLGGAPMAIIDKHRDRPNQASATHVIGDVNGKVAVLIDDMIDTAGTISAAAEVLLNEGAREVFACATHGVLSGPAIERLNNSVFSKVIVTDTIPQGDKPSRCQKLEVVSVASLLASSIHNIHAGLSVSALF